jgi:hypothetical protein
MSPAGYLLATSLVGNWGRGMNGDGSDVLVFPFVPKHVRYDMAWSGLFWFVLVCCGVV